MNKNSAPVIIKKVKGKGHAAHHGGAWKVAYADFVTAMMAFFLLLWLLNVTTDVQKRGIADYFEPTISSKSQSGAGGVLGGLTIGSPGAQAVPTSSPSFEPAERALRQPDDGDDGNNGGGAATDPSKDDQAAQVEVKPLDEKALQRQFAAREEQRFQQAEKALKDAMKDVPELAKLAKNLLIEDTPEGLRIQLIDQDKQPMFPLGSAEMLAPAKQLMALVAKVVQRLPNKIAISGHTEFHALFDGRQLHQLGIVVRPGQRQPARVHRRRRPGRSRHPHRRPGRPRAAAARRCRLAGKPPHQHRAPARGQGTGADGAHRQVGMGAITLL